jgi:hypothetical protein
VFAVSHQDESFVFASKLIVALIAIPIEQSGDDARKSGAEAGENVFDAKPTMTKKRGRLAGPQGANLTLQTDSRMET